MANVTRNIVANLGGNAWQALMGFAFVPVYLRYIGAEGYGLIGFFGVLVTALSILDGGFSAAMGRELARASLKQEDLEAAGDLVLTLEVLFWLASTVIGLGLVLAAPLMAEHWLQRSALSHETATMALRLMGVGFVVQWPGTYYTGCLNGLQQQVHLTALNVALGTGRGLGAALILWLVSPTVEAFFAWQLALAILGTACLRYLLRSKMPLGRAHFRLNSVASLGQFAAGVGGINLLALVLLQLDKAILSKILPLKDFGYYTLAWTLAGLTFRISNPIFSAIYPRLTQLVSVGVRHQVEPFYQKAYELMSVAVVPFSLHLAFFSEPLLALWTRDPFAAKAMAAPLAFVALGTMLNALLHVPYGLQLANSWTRLAFYLNVGCIAVMVPALLALTNLYGVVGAAATWPLLNILYLVIMGGGAHRHLLPGAWLHWFVSAVARPIAICALLYAAAWLCLWSFEIGWARDLVSVLLLGAVYLLATALVVLASAPLRSAALQQLGALSRRARRVQA